MAKRQPNKDRFRDQRRSPLWLGLGWLSGVSLLGSNLALAQTPLPDAPPPVPPAPSSPLPSATTAPAIPPAVSQPETLPPAPSPVELAPVSPVAPAPRASAPAMPPATPTPQAATDSDGPAAIVFSARASGCRYVLKQGQPLPGSLCPQPIQTARQNHLSPSLRPGGSVAPVSVGPIRLSSSGLALGTTPSLRDYYRRSLRPPGRPDNGNTRLLFPLAIPAPITSLFGWRMHPLTGDRRFHAGVDLGAPMGTPVLAAYAGRVVLADFLGGYGLAVALEHHKATQQTLYAHLSEIFVQPGEWVKQGSVIGRVGSTGNSTGPHLHFELRELTSEGWMAVDAGTQLETALAQLVRSLQVAKAPVKPATAKQPAVKQSTTGIRVGPKMPG